MPANAPPTAISHPVRGSSGAGASGRRAPARRRSRSRAASPAWSPRLDCRSRKMPVLPPNTPPPPPPPNAAGPPAWPATGQAVVVEDQRPDAVVGGTGDPRPVRGRRQRHEQRPREADHDHRETAGEQLADRRARAPGRGQRATTDPRRRDPGHDDQRDPHLRLEAEADHDPAQHQPTRAAGLERAHREPQRRHATAASAARQGCCGATIATVIGVVASTRPATNPAGRPNRRRVRS